MKTFVNASLLTIGTGLVILGSKIIETNLLVGTVEVLLGLLIYVVYEKFPT